VIERNHGWIRDFFINLASKLYFKYFITALSLFTILFYMTSSIVHTFSNDETYENIGNGYLSEFIIEHAWDIQVVNEKKPWIKIAYMADKHYMRDITNTIEKKLHTPTNQYLQTGNTLNIQSDFWEPVFNEEEYKNSFDIEKIIADLHLPKEKKVAVIAKELWIDWKNEKSNYAKLAWINWNYVWSLEQNQKIRDYLIRNAQEIYKDKHGRNEWDTLDLVSQEIQEVKLNAQEITWLVTYNDVTLKVVAPIESFPEWTILKIKTLWDDNSMTNFDITLKEIMLLAQVDKLEYDAPMASFDISFYAPDDTQFLNELQPAEWKSVSVTFDYGDNNEFKNDESTWFLAIYHMEDNDDTSIANLVSTKSSKDISKNNKSDSISIYANTLSVYILTIVSDLEEETSSNSGTVKFDAGYGGFIVNSNDIILSSSRIDADVTYTWKILSKDNSVTLPEVHVASWYNFWWWYNGNTFLWDAWTVFELSKSMDTESEQSDLDIENNYEIYACLYENETDSNLCTFSEKKDSTSEFLEEIVDDEVMVSDIDSYTPSDEEIKKYGEEVFKAYNRAIGEGITTIDDINKAKLNTKITRAELAKMMVVYMSWVLQKEPVVTDEVNYKDINSRKLWNLTWYIQLAYQYQIMGINADWSPMDNFNPNEPVSRWEFATVLSRVLFGEIYNQDGINYYEQHIEALNKANILNDTNPNLTEWRWWIMTMLYRSQSMIQSNTVG